MQQPEVDRIATATAVLAKAKTYGWCPYKTNEEKRLAIESWAQALHRDTTPEDAVNAVIEHFATSTEYFTVSHVNRLTAQYRARRVAGGAIPYPDTLRDDPKAQVEWGKAYHWGLVHGMSHDLATRHANTALRIGWKPGATDQKVIAAPADVSARLEHIKKQFGKERKGK